MSVKQTDPELPLAGLRVIELHAIGPVPFAGLQLQIMGASVTRLCPPEDRDIGIALDTDFDLLNRGKLVQRINLKSPEGHAQLHELLAEADVLMEGFRPGVLERLGLQPELLIARYPSLIIGRLCGFGRKGEYASRAGHDINYLALSGVLAAIGPAEEPAIPLNLIADFGGGAMHLLNGILARLVQRSLSGKGGIIDTSILAGTLGLTGMMHGLLAANRWSLDRQSNLLDGGLPFYRLYKTQDKKFMAVGALEPPFYEQLIKLLKLEKAITTQNQYDQASWHNTTLLFTDAFAQRSREQWSMDAQQYDCCVTPVLDFHEAMAHSHNLSNGWVEAAPFAHPGKVVEFLSPE